MVGAGSGEPEIDVIPDDVTTDDVNTDDVTTGEPSIAGQDNDVDFVIDEDEIKKHPSPDLLIPVKGRRFPFFSKLSFLICFLVAVVILLASLTMLGVLLSKDSKNSVTIQREAAQLLADETTSAAPVTMAPPVVDVRLPTSLDPLLYTVELQPNMYAPLTPEQFTFNGSVKINLACKITTTNVTLHINNLNITGVIGVSEDGGAAGLYRSHSIDSDHQFLVIVTFELLGGRNYTVDIFQFEGQLLSDQSGLYFDSYARNGDTEYFVATHLMPTDARKIFPCMDEPAIKSQFKVTLYREGHMTAVSNMPLETPPTTGPVLPGIVRRRRSPAGGWKEDIFLSTPFMSAHLLAFVIGDFDYQEQTTSNGKRFRVWARPEVLTQMTYAKDVGADVLDYLEGYFNVTFPVSKQDIVAIPNYASDSIGHWGMVTCSESAILFDASVSSESDKQDVALLVANGLVHQWFGNLVTPSWWDDLWLNEGFASYVEYMGVDVFHPDWKMLDQFVVQELQTAFNDDGVTSSHPLYVPIYNSGQVTDAIDDLTHIKGASVVRMLRFILGDVTFQAGIHQILEQFKFGAVTHDDVWHVFENKSVANSNPITNVKDIMDTWTLQMNYPVVMVTHNVSGEIQLTQSRYLRDPNATDPGVYESPFGYLWNIPFTYTTSQSPNFDVTVEDIHMLTSTSHVINSVDIPAPEGDNWVLGNPMEYGYYRVNYDDRNWISLIEQLMRDHSVIHPVNRAQIINDAMNLAKSGQLNMTIALRTTEYLDTEREWIVWVAASEELGFVRSMLERHPLYGSFTLFVQNKTTEVFNDLLLDDTGASNLQSYLRTYISSLACSYDIQACIDGSKSLFDYWMANPSINPIDPGVKSTVYCTAVAQGGVDEWEFVLNQYQTANLVAEKSRLLSAMACSRQTWLLSRLLDMAVDPTTLPRDSLVDVFLAVSRNAIGRPLAWNYLQTNWDFFLTEFENDARSLAKLIGGVTESFNSEGDFTQLKGFVESQENLGSAARAFDQALEKTRSNINWMTANVPVIQIWLDSQGY